MLFFFIGVVVGCVVTVIVLNSLSKYADGHMNNNHTQYPKKEIDPSNLPRKDINLIENRFKNKQY